MSGPFVVSRPVCGRLAGESARSLAGPGPTVSGDEAAGRVATSGWDFEPAKRRRQTENPFPRGNGFHIDAAASAQEMRDSDRRSSRYGVRNKNKTNGLPMADWVG